MSQELGPCPLCDQPVFGEKATALVPYIHFVCAHQAATGVAISDRMLKRIDALRKAGKWDALGIAQSFQVKG